MDVPNYWKNKFIQLLEKHVELSDEMIKLKQSLKKKKTKSPKGTGKRRGNNRRFFISACLYKTKKAYSFTEKNFLLTILFSILVTRTIKLNAISY